MRTTDIDWYDIYDTIRATGIQISDSEDAAVAVSRLLGIPVPE